MRTYVLSCCLRYCNHIYCCLNVVQSGGRFIGDSGRFFTSWQKCTHAHPAGQVKTSTGNCCRRQGMVCIFLSLCLGNPQAQHDLMSCSRFELWSVGQSKPITFFARAHTTQRLMVWSPLNPRDAGMSVPSRHSSIMSVSSIAVAHFIEGVPQ